MAHVLVNVTVRAQADLTPYAIEDVIERVHLAVTLLCHLELLGPDLFERAITCILLLQHLLLADRAPITI